MDSSNRRRRNNSLRRSRLVKVGKFHNKKLKLSDWRRSAEDSAGIFEGVDIAWERAVDQTCRTEVAIAELE
jgi:hypothetical protein